MKHLTVIIWLLLLAAQALAQNARIYDSRLNLHYRVENGRIYDNQMRQVGRIERDRIYDNRMRQVDRIEPDRSRTPKRK